MQNYHTNTATKLAARLTDLLEFSRHHYGATQLTVYSKRPADGCITEPELIHRELLSEFINERLN